ncbi:MAG: NADH-quinone oxidoreductase subunit M [Bradymonadales bacterium]|nr:NADH-quinone oxidoreductase subunit M [Bradymonadales bacterium]
MGLSGVPWLSLVIFGPLLGAIGIGLIPRDQKALLRNLAFFSSLGVFALSIPLVLLFDPARGDFQLTMQQFENVAWIPALGVRYQVGVDGISLFLIVLTTFLTPLCILSAYRAVEDRVKEYLIALLVLETGMLGALAALDVFLFYIFWEVMLIPMYLIIGVWGGPRRRYAAVKFFLYTMVGSVLMLVAILYVYSQGEVADFSVEHLWATAQGLGGRAQLWLFLAFALAFAIKVPLFPLHTWLPDAHVEAPTAGSVILAGVLLKMGTFGFVRYAMPMFPEALQVCAPYIALLALIGIIYGALVAWVQSDVKSLVAYSSVSHLGFVVLGLMALTPQGISGGTFLMLAHGVSTGGLFLCVGFLYERRHRRLIADFGGIARVVPVFSAIFLVIVLASAGLPGLSGFVGEFLVLIGASQSHSLHFGPVEYSFFGRVGPSVTSFLFAGLATLGVILAALYLLSMVRRMLFGPVVHEANTRISDASPRELAYLVPVVLAAFFLGIFPGFFTSRIEATTARLLEVIEGPGAWERTEEFLATVAEDRHSAAQPIANASDDRDQTGDFRVNAPGDRGPQGRWRELVQGNPGPMIERLAQGQGDQDLTGDLRRQVPSGVGGRSDLPEAFTGDRLAEGRLLARGSVDQARIEGLPVEVPR